METYSAVLLLVGDLGDSTRELSGLADGGKGGTKTHGDQGAKEEATGVETDDDVDLAVDGGVDVVDDVGDDHLDGDGVLEQGEDVLEEDALLGEVWNLTDESVDALEIHG